jgi:hypothetical protein
MRSLKLACKGIRINYDSFHNTHAPPMLRVVSSDSGQTAESELGSNKSQ